MHPSDCSLNMKTGYLFAAEEIGTEYYTYTKSSVAIKDVFYKDEPLPNGCTPQNTVDDCLNTDITGQSPLRYKAYFPLNTAHDYTTTPLPVVILFHAGGFQECTHFELPIMETFCEELSRKGFIAITAEYRRGRLKDNASVDSDTDYTSVQQQLASYRAQQDGRGAIRSIMKRDNVNGHDNKFKINTEQVFVGGTSAGGIIAMGAAYYRTQSMVNKVFPKKGSSTYTIQDALGPIQADNYYGSAAYWPVIKGVLNCWGGIAIPKENDSDEAAFFSDGAGANDNPPMIAFHGALDLTVPYFDDPNQDSYFSKRDNSAAEPLLYVAEDFCLELSGGNSYAIKSSTNSNPVTVKLCSSINMYNVLSSLNRFTEVYIDCDMGHGLDKDTSDFGITITNPNNTDEVEKYIAQRTAVFFQTIMREPNIQFGDKGRSIFRDCENNRVCTTSGTGEDNECSSSNDIECPKP
jgi:hypothetical protein